MATDLSSMVMEQVNGPAGLVIVLLAAVKYLISIFEKEQNKRESAYLSVIEMYQAELKSSNTRNDVLAQQIIELTKQVAQLVEHNSVLMARLEAIEQPVIRVLAIFEDEYRKAVK